MIWFVYRTFTLDRGIFYDWKEENLKHCIDQEEAKKWREDNKWIMIKETIKLPLWKSISIQIPVVEWWDPDTDFFSGLTATKIQWAVQQTIWDLLKKYEIMKWWVFMKRARIKEERHTDTLMYMRDILEWMFRITDIKIQTDVNKDTKEPIYTSIPFWQSRWLVPRENDNKDMFNDNKVSYTVNWKEYRTNLFWIYTWPLKQMMMSDENWNLFRNFGTPSHPDPLQPRQNDLLFKRGRITFCIWPREWWKSLVASAIIASFLNRELCYKDDAIRWFSILYYWPDNKNNRQYYDYVKRLLKKITKNSKFIKYKDTDQVIEMDDWWSVRTIEFISALSEIKGRGRRPAFVVIDESAIVDVEVFRVAIGTTNIPILCISTVDSRTKKNRFYEMFMDALNEMQNYEPIDELIHRLYTKYNLDKVKSYDEIYAMIKDWTFDKIRSDFYSARNFVALRYTIDDISPLVMTDDEKRQKLAVASKLWEKFAMAEYYWYYMEDDTVFPYEWLVTSDIPTSFDHIIVWYDPAEQYDNAWFVTIGVKQDDVYVIDSKILKRDFDVKIQEIKSTLKVLKEKYSTTPLFAMDITRSSSDMILSEDRWLFIDYPVKSTPWKTSAPKQQWRERLIWKQQLVKLVKEQFFDRWILKISSALWNEWWLIDEIAHYKCSTTKNWWYEYKAEHGFKDDQVSALLVALYCAYDESVRYSLIKKDSEKPQYVYFSDAIKEKNRNIQNDSLYTNIINLY